MIKKIKLLNEKPNQITTGTYIVSQFMNLCNCSNNVLTYLVTKKKKNKETTVSLYTGS